MKKIRLELIRGDSKDVKFQRQLPNNNEVITEKPDDMHITFKNSSYDEDYILQKVLDKDIFFNETDNYYYFSILPSDTENLAYGTYVFDIEIIKDGYVKTIATGTLKIKEEITYANNR